MRFVDPDDASTHPRVVLVTEVHIRPDGCRSKVHINRSECYDYGTEVERRGHATKGMLDAVKGKGGFRA